MPKITNKNYQIAGKNYPCSVWYTASDKFFLKDFPLNVERAAKITPLGSKTEEELYQRYEEGILRYEELISKTKKVIIFKLSAAKKHIDGRYATHSYENKMQFPQGISGNIWDTMGFTITYEIKMMREVGKSYYLYNIDTDGNPYGSGDEIKNKNAYKIIDYTNEREEAFIELYKRFDKMFLAFLEGFFTPEKFIDSIPTTKLLS